MPHVHRYDILRPLGSGSFGVVYLARYHGAEGFSRLVAIKVLREELEMPEEIARRTRDEARILGLLRHRAIVAAERFTSIDGRAAIVMEYVEGASLARILQVRPIPWRVAVEIAAEIAMALRVGYETNGPEGRPLRLLHRDIKPSNVLVTRHGEVKVLDFGIARADFVGREAETSSVNFGSPAYMAPERARQIEGPGADIYSLGVVLWEMVAQTRMGQSAPSQRSQDARVSELLGTLSDLRPEVPDELLSLLGEMLEFSPEQRPSALEVERCCLELLQLGSDEALRWWAGEVVTPLLDTSDRTDLLGWSGRSIEEHTSSRTEDAVLPALPWWRRIQVPPARAVGAALGLVLTLSPASLLAWWLAGRGEAAVEPAPPAEPTPVITDGKDQPVVVPDQLAEPAPTVSGAAPQPAEKPETKPAKPKGTTRRASRSGAHVTCEGAQIAAWYAGSPEAVALSRHGIQATLPACLPMAGVYDVTVTKGDQARASGQLQIRPPSGDQEVRLQCSDERCWLAALQ